MVSNERMYESDFRLLKLDMCEIKALPSQLTAVYSFTRRIG